MENTGVMVLWRVTNEKELPKARQRKRKKDKRTTAEPTINTLTGEQR